MFRVASESRATWNLAKTFAQIVVFWGLFLAVIPYAIRLLEAEIGVPPFAFPGQRAAGVALFALCSALGLWSGVSMSWLGRGTPLPLDAPRALVTRGPYAYVRNPMAVAGLGQGLAVAIAIGSVLTVAYVVAGGLIWNWLVRPVEEEDLRRRFGAAYEAYRRDVRCWVPRLGRR
jgi:protein-S-isoprenylcysteine O-methyltransferase Ste14